MALKSPNPHSESLRYEIKMVCHDRALQWVLAYLRFHQAGIRKLYPARRVQSIYFDTPGGRALVENLAGVSHREKVRFRWYGEETRQTQGILELKVRENAMGWKEQLRLEKTFLVEGVDRFQFVRELLNQVPPRWHLMVSDGLEPVQWITYMREYYVTASGKVRITVDQDMKACDQRGRKTLSFRFASLLPKVMIVEAKFDPQDYEEAREIMSRFPLFVDKCSKFVMASDLSSAPIISMRPQ